MTHAIRPSDRSSYAYEPSLDRLKDDMREFLRWRPCTESYAPRMMIAIRNAGTLAAAVDAIRRSYWSQGLNDRHWEALLLKSRSLEEVHLFLDIIPKEQRREEFYAKALSHLSLYREPSWDLIEELYREAEKGGFARGDVVNRYMELASQFGKVRVQSRSLPLKERLDHILGARSGSSHLAVRMTTDLKGCSSLTAAVAQLEKEYSGIAPQPIHLGMMMKKASSLEEVHLLLEKVRPSDRTEYFYGALMQHFFDYKEPRWEIVEAVFQEACERRMLNHFTASAYMLIAARERKDFSLIRDAFERVTKKELALYNIFIQCAGKCKHFLEAQAAYDSVPKKDKFTFTNYIVAAGEAKEKGEIKRAYDEAKQAGCVDQKLENAYVHAMGDLKLVRQVVREKETRDPIAYQGLLKAADRTENFANVHRAYNDAIEAGAISEALFVLYIRMAAKYKKWDEMEKSHELSKEKFAQSSYIEKAFDKGCFERALDEKNFGRALQFLPQDEMYCVNQLMQSANLCHRFDLVEKFFKELPKDEVTYTCYLHALGRSGTHKVTEVALGYQEAMTHYPDCIEITNAYIVAMGNMGAEGPAYIAFDNARTKGILQSMTYGSMIAAAKNYELAEFVFRTGKENGMLTVIGMNSFLQKALDAKRFEKAEEVYHQMVEQKIADDATHSIFMIGSATLGQNRAANLAWQTAPKESINLQNSRLKALFLMKEPRAAKEHFDALVRRGIADLFTYLTYLKYAPEDRAVLETAPLAIRQDRRFQVDPEWLMKSFDSIEWKDSLDYAKYIESAGKVGRLGLAYKAFCEAKEHGCADKYVYNTMMHAAKIVGRIELMHELFAEAKAQGIIDQAAYTNMISINPDLFHEAIRLFEDDLAPLYNAYIHVAPWDEALRSFEYAVEHGIANHITYATIIDIAGKRGRFNVAMRAFREAKDKGLLNMIGYNAYMHAAFLNNKWQIVHDIYKEIPAPTVETHNTYINAAACMGRFSHAEAVFKRAVDEGIANEGTYNCWIKACGLRKDFPAAEAAFKKAPKKDAWTYKAILTAASETGFLGALERYYQEAVDRNLADPNVHSAYAEGMEKNRQPAKAYHKSSYDVPIIAKIQSAFSLEEAAKVLREAQGKRLDNEPIYAAYIQKAILLGRQDVADQIHTEMHSRLNNSTDFYYALMDTFARAGQWPQVKFAFNLAKMRGLDRGVLYSNYIKAMGRAGDWEEVQLAFNGAKAQAITLEDHVYAAMMEACALMQHVEVSEMIYREAFVQHPSTLIVGAILKAVSIVGDWSRANVIFNEAKPMGLISPYLYAQMIEFAANQKRFSEAKRLVKEAESAFGSLPSSVHTAYVHALAIEATFTGDGISKFVASKVFQQAHIPITKVDDTTIDVRGMMKGVVLIALKDQIRFSCPLHVIVGDGNIDKASYEDTKSFIKEHLYRVLPDHEYWQDPENEGRFTIRSKSVKRTRRE